MYLFRILFSGMLCEIEHMHAYSSLDVNQFGIFPTVLIYQFSFATKIPSVYTLRITYHSCLE